MSKENILLNRNITDTHWTGELSRLIVFQALHSGLWQ